MEKGLLQSAGAGFGGDLGRVGDDFGEGLEDGGAAGDDGRARFGKVPVAVILSWGVSGWAEGEER